MGDHPTIDELQKFLEEHSAGENRELNRRVVRHLLSGCSSCRECLQALGGSGRPAPLFQDRENLPEEDEQVPGYDAALARTEEAFSLFLSGGRPVQEPPGSLLAELAPLPRGAGSHRGASLPLLIKWMIGRSYEARFDDPEAMQSWALMARLAAETCSAAEAGSATRLADLRARAWAHLANSLKVKGFLVSAEKAVNTAQHYLQAGTGDPSIRSWVLGLAASLLCKQENYREAAELADCAGRISNLTGEYEEEANSLLIQTSAWHYAGEVEAAIDLLRRALARPEYRRDSQWEFIARHNLLQSYIHAGYMQKALDLTKILDFQASQPVPSLVRLRMLWLQGELLSRQDCLELAQTVFCDAYNGYVQKKMLHPIAALCTELVTLYGKMGFIDKAEPLVTKTLAILRSLHAEPDVLASVAQLL